MDTDLLSVASLHALAYCERLFYLEEVERIRIADASVFAGRRLHVELAEEGDIERHSFESAALGLIGAVDVLRRRDGRLIPYEHKRGRSAGTKGKREAWRTDRIQVGAYALLVEEAFGQTIPDARVRYHADGVTITVPMDEALRAEIHGSIVRARALRASIDRPPVTDNERLCRRCSLAPVCLPEESRLGADPAFEPIRVLPEHPRGETLHVTDPGTQVGRAGEEIVVRPREGAATRVPSKQIGQIVLHGVVQISTQALRLCVDNQIGVHWVTATGGLVGSLAPTDTSGQRHLRQFRGLADADRGRRLARQLVIGKVQGQLRFALRGTRAKERRGDDVAAISEMRAMVRRVARAESLDELRGLEGNAAVAYFTVLRGMLVDGVDPRLRMGSRSKRPPTDRFNALLGYGYGSLYREVLCAAVSVGLHPSVGFYHQPRSAAHTLVLDVMELFRVPLVDMAVVAAINRGTFDADADFRELPGRVLLSEAGRIKAIEVFERRKAECWKHSVVGYSLSYARMIELELRLLEKEWMNEGGLFARFRLR
jgi:CRISPR-associated protein Cas1